MTEGTRRVASIVFRLMYAFLFGNLILYFVCWNSTKSFVKYRTLRLYRIFNRKVCYVQALTSKVYITTNKNHLDIVGLGCRRDYILPLRTDRFNAKWTTGYSRPLLTPSST